MSKFVGAAGAAVRTDGGAAARGLAGDALVRGADGPVRAVVDAFGTVEDRGAAGPEDAGFMALILGTLSTRGALREAGAVEAAGAFFSSAPFLPPSMLPRPRLSRGLPPPMSMGSSREAPIIRPIMAILKPFLRPLRGTCIIRLDLWSVRTNLVSWVWSFLLSTGV
jgi:hypothetical protein